MDPGLDCLNPDFRTDTKADPMKDTEGAVVTLISMYFRYKTHTGTDGKRFLKNIYIIVHK